jgi:L-rhamnose mutarotase
MGNIFRHQFKAKIQERSLEVFAKLLREKNGEIDGHLAGLNVDFFKIFQFDDLLFVYLESQTLLTNFDFPAILDEVLVDWPGESGPQKFVSMLDIFHDAIPRAESVWRDSGASRESLGSIVYLRPEKYCSYVFYHFQLQEEGVRKFNKHYVIGAHENCLFSYQELPAVIDKTNHDRVLSTNVSPENWVELMGEHFRPWPEGLDIDAPWKSMEEIFSYSTYSTNSGTS